MDRILIRAVAEEDLGSIVELLRELTDFAHSAIELDIAHVQRLYSTMLNNPHQYKNLVACLNGSVIGFISVVYYLSFFHRGGTALINELIVSAEHRNAGVGKALVQRAVCVSSQDGMDEIEVGTERDNRRGIAFCKAAGFDEEYVLLGMEFERERTYTEGEVFPL
jgi:GNAT superfamily N-acetyltransferase